MVERKPCILSVFADKRKFNRPKFLSKFVVKFCFRTSAYFLS